MADPITWYTLGRTVADPELIMEMVDDKFKAHNEDLSAHGQTSESVWTHRTGEPFDHPQYVVYNINMAPSTRTVKAFCDVGGAAEFERIQDAIDYVHGEGGGRVFILAGTYTQTADLILYSDIELEGEDDDTTIIDFADSEYKVKAFGTSGSHLRNIRLKHIQVRNSEVNNAGAIDFNYVDDSLIFDCKLYSNGDATGNTTYAVRIRSGTNFVILRTCFESNDYGVWYGGMAGSELRDCYFSSTTNFSVLMRDGSRCEVSGNYFTNLSGPGIEVDGTGEGTMILGNVVETVDRGIWNNSKDNVVIDHNRVVLTAGNNEYCIFIGAADNCIVTSNHCSGANNDGIYLNTADNIIVVGNRCFSNVGFGVNVANAACDKCIVLGNQLVGNTAGGLQDNGTNTMVAHNIVA